MLGFDSKSFKLNITVSDAKKKEALQDFARMNDKINNMFKYTENPETPPAERNKYAALAFEFLKTISMSARILEAMGVPNDEIRKNLIFLKGRDACGGD